MKINSRCPCLPKFHEEAFANITTGLLDYLLKAKTREKKSPLHVSSPVDIKTLLERREKAISYHHFLSSSYHQQS